MNNTLRMSMFALNLIAFIIGFLSAIIFLEVI